MVISDSRHTECSNQQDGHNIYVIMKTMCPPGCYHRNGFVVTHALGHMMYGYTLLVPMNQRVLNNSLPCLLSTLWFIGTSKCVTVHHVPKCMSCHKAIVVITGRAHCLHDYTYIYIYIDCMKHETTSINYFVLNTL